LEGASYVALGGGRTAAPHDSLFRFKRSLGGDVWPFTAGLFTHDRRELTSLVQAAERRHPSIAASSLFLRYRSAPGFSEGRMIPVSPGSLAGRTA